MNGFESRDAKPTADPGASTKAEWYADGLAFNCTRCGNCCTGPPGYVYFTEEEGRAMAKRVGLSVKAFYKRYAHRVGGRWSLDERYNPAVRGYDCVFLTRDDAGLAGCSLYEDRPTQCRTWPFWPDNIRSPRTWAETARTCPGVNLGKVYTVDEIRIIRDQTPEL
jgi:hypothetical protein